MQGQKEKAIVIEASVQPFLDEIAERLFSGHAAIMVGAGFSRNAVPNGEARPQFPTWVELGDAFYEKLYDGEDNGGVDKKKKYLNTLKLAFQIETNFGRPALDKIIADRIPDMYYEPSRLHERLLELPWQDVFTTNYDTLLERASRKVLERKYSLILNADDLIYAEKPRIIKLHGSLPSIRPFILTEEDYRQYPKSFAPFVNTVQQSLLENALCMIGFSGDDPNFLHWIGWIRDNIGTQRSSKMYFIGIDPVAPIDRTIFDQRHIVYIDASKCAHEKTASEKIEVIFDYLTSRVKIKNGKLWNSSKLDKPASEERINSPVTTEVSQNNRISSTVNKQSLSLNNGIFWQASTVMMYPKGDAKDDRLTEISNVVSQWRIDRKEYPGWCVTPARLRESIWTYTGNWAGSLKQGEALPDSLDFDFFYELNWRMERCLFPLFGDTATAVRDCLGRYWPFTDRNPLSQSGDLSQTPEKGRGRDFLCDRWCVLALSLLRYYREEGLYEDWTLFTTILKDHEDLLSSEQRASFAYERCLYCLFEVDLEGLDREFEGWPENTTLPFWEAKRAGLLAERGHMDEAVKLLDRSLADIRVMQNLKPVSSDFTLVSQETYVMVLRRYVGEALDFDRHEHLEEKGITNDYTARWTELKQYLCDPWEELSVFEKKLEAEPLPRRRVTMKYGFDIGSASRTTNLFSGPDPQALDGYSFIRFLEETAIPVSLPFMSFGKKAAIGALPRIAPYSSHWALCAAARIGDSDIADQLFNRRAILRLDRATVDGYVVTYIQTAKRIYDSVEQLSGRNQMSLGNYATKVIPEILSRLCCKSSPESHEKVLSFIEHLYRVNNKALYDGVAHLVERLIESASWEELIAYVPRFLKLEIPQETHPLIERQFINPLSFFFDPEYTSEDRIHKIAVERATIERLFQNTAGQSEKTRTWSIVSLYALMQLGVLDEKQGKKFGELIWVGNSGDRLLEHSGLYKFASLDLPIPEGIDARGRFKKYLIETPLPVIGDSHKGVSLAGGNFPIIADLLGSAEYLEWTDSEIHALLGKLISWWDSDKQYLAAEEKDEVSSGLGSIPEEARARLARLPDIMANVISPLLRKGATGDDTKEIARLMEEARAANMPYLKMKLAFTPLFPEEHSNLIGEMAEALSSSRQDTIFDALRAMLFSLDSPQGSALSTPEELGHLLFEVGGIVRWRYEPGLISAMNTIRRFVLKRPVCFDRAIEASVLVGLKELVHETDPATLEIADMPRELEARKYAAALSFRLFEHYRSSSKEVPAPIREWEALCASPEEFAEIRNKWE
jgi:hypothetical protein